MTKHQQPEAFPLISYRLWFVLSKRNITYRRNYPGNTKKFRPVYLAAFKQNLEQFAHLK